MEDAAKLRIRKILTTIILMTDNNPTPQQNMENVKELKKLFENLGARQFQSKPYLKWHDAKVAFITPQVLDFCEQMYKENEEQKIAATLQHETCQSYETLYKEVALKLENGKAFLHQAIGAGNSGKTGSVTVTIRVLKEVLDIFNK